MVKLCAYQHWTCQRWHHTQRVCAHQHRLVKNGAMLGVRVCINTDLSKMVLCSGCGCAHWHRLCQRWLIGTWVCVCVCVWVREREREREREHTNMDLETVIANELTHHGVWGLTLNPIENCLLITYHPSFMVCLWVLVYSDMKGVLTNDCWD
jgi:hypothetical protein